MTALLIPFPCERRSPPASPIRIGDRVRYRRGALDMFGIVTTIFLSGGTPRIRFQTHYGSIAAHPDYLTPWPTGGGGDNGDTDKSGLFADPNERPHWCPLCRPGANLRFGDAPGMAFGAHIRERHDPLWLLEADHPGDADEAAELADRIEAAYRGAADFDDAPDGILFSAGLRERQAALTLLRDRFAGDPAALLWLRQDVEWPLERWYAEKGTFDARDITDDEDWY